MSVWVWILIAVGAVIVLAVLGLAIKASVDRRRLRTRFGPEYERTVDTADSRRRAERELTDRAKRRDELDIRPLSPQARARYSEQWREVQGRFVDQPEAAVEQADELLTIVMRERGYPVDDFADKVDLVSVDHPEVVDNYRVAHGIQDKNRTRRASTEELREAVVRYRSLFEELLGDDGQVRAQQPEDLQSRG